MPTLFIYDSDLNRWNIQKRLQGRSKTCDASNNGSENDWSLRYGRFTPSATLRTSLEDVVCNTQEIPLPPDSLHVSGCAILARESFGRHTRLTKAL